MPIEGQPMWEDLAGLLALADEAILPTQLSERGNAA